MKYIKNTYMYLYYIVLCYILCLQFNFLFSSLLENFFHSILPSNNSKKYHLFRAYYALGTVLNILSAHFFNMLYFQQHQKIEVDIFIEFTLWINKLRFGRVL